MSGRLRSNTGVPTQRYTITFGNNSATIIDDVIEQPIESYESRLRFSFLYRHSGGYFDFIDRFSYQMKFGAIWFDRMCQTWRELTPDFFREISSVLFNRMMTEAKRLDRRGRQHGRYVRIPTWQYDLYMIPDMADEVEMAQEIFEDDDAATIPSRVFKKVTISCSQLRDGSEPYFNDFVLVRDVNLLERLRQRIYELSLLRKTKAALVRLCMRTKVVQGEPDIEMAHFQNGVQEDPDYDHASDLDSDDDSDLDSDDDPYDYSYSFEMDTGHGDEQGEGLEKKSNVVLGQTEQQSVAANFEIPNITWARYSTNEQLVETYNPIVDRYTLFANIEWTIEQSQESSLFSYDLPNDALAALCVGSSRCSVPFCVPFNIYRYWNGDINIKIQLNSNKFQIGRIMVAWYYYPAGYEKNRDNMYTASQTPHVLLNAGSSNEAELVIPYKHWKPMLTTKARKDCVVPLVVGRMQAFILAPLAIAPGANGPKSAYISLFISLPRSQFTGLVDGGIRFTETEMLSTISTVLKKADKIIGDINCDNPISTQPVQYLVPTASHNWSAGTGVSEVIHNLRLDYSTIGSARVGDIGVSQSAIGIPASTFGLLKPFAWEVNVNNSYGKMIWDMNVHPMCDKDKLRVWLGKGEVLSKYAIPPVGVLSSMFMYWRGTLELKFEIVSSQFHTGRLLVAYIPGFTGRNVTLNQAKNSAHAVFSLQEASSFTFRVPYIADRPWWHRRYAGPQRRREVTAPSKVFLFVLNPLVPMEQVAKKVWILPYIRGGPDFEVAVPVQPSLGLRFIDTAVVNNDFRALTKVGYAPCYIGTWHSTPHDKQAVLRYGSGSDHVSQIILPVVKPPAESYAVWTCSENLSFKSSANVVSAVYYVFWHDSGYIYALVATIDTTLARQAAKMLQLGKGPGDIPVECFVSVSEEGAYGKSDVLRFIPKYYDIDDDIPIDKRKVIPSKDFASKYGFVCPEMDERRDSILPINPGQELPSSSFGRMFFNESFNDLKDLARRYQLLWSDTIKYDNSGQSTSNNAILRFSAIPMGFSLDVAGGKIIWNIMRDGHIPIICDGYRYFRGGLRYKLVAQPDSGINFWVQHHPDKPYEDNKLHIVSKREQADYVRNHTYAQYVQSTSVNNVVEFEIPFYLPANYGVLGTPNSYDINTDASEYYSLGDVVIGIESSDRIKDNLNLSLYYSVADDFSLNVFTGFSPKVFCDEAYQYVEPQMFKSVSNVFNRGVSSIRGMVRDEVCAGVTEAVDPIINQIKPSMNVLTDELKEWMDSVGLTVCFTELLHICANPTPGTIAISFVSIILILCQATISAIGKLLGPLKDALSSLFSTNWMTFLGQQNDPQEVDEGYVFENNFLSEITKQDIFVISSSIFSMITCMMGLTVAAPKSYPDILRGVNGQVSLINNVIKLMQNCGDTVMYVVRYVLGYSDSRAIQDLILERNLPDIVEWIEEVHTLLDPRSLVLINRDQTFANRVYDACTFGSVIITENLNKGNRVIEQMYKDLCKIRDKMIDMGNHPDVRFEPFVIWVSGRQGIGKSFMTSKICGELLRHINYQTEEAMIYWLTSTTKYWNGVRNPPVIARDDAFNLDGTLMEEELANFFMIKSSCILNPNMAAVEEKNKRLNPLIYFLNSNFSFPVIPPAKLPAAVYRRRQALIECRYTKEVIDKYGFGDVDNIYSAELIDNDDRKSCLHLEFRRSRNPTVNDEQAWGPWISYSEMMLELKNDFKKFYINEQKNFADRVREAYSLSSLPNEIPAVPDLVYKQSIKQRIEEKKRQVEFDRCSDGLDSDIVQMVRNWGKKLREYWSSRGQHQMNEEDVTPKEAVDHWNNCVTRVNAFEPMIEVMFEKVNRSDDNYSDESIQKDIVYWESVRRVLLLHKTVFNDFYRRVEGKEMSDHLINMCLHPSDFELEMRRDDIQYDNNYCKDLLANFYQFSQRAYYKLMPCLDERKVIVNENDRLGITLLLSYYQCLVFLLCDDFMFKSLCDGHGEAMLLRMPDSSQDVFSMIRWSRVISAALVCEVCPLSLFIIQRLEKVADMYILVNDRKLIVRDQYSILEESIPIDCKPNCKGCIFAHPLLKFLLDEYWIRKNFNSFHNLSFYIEHTFRRRVVAGWIEKQRFYLSLWYEERVSRPFSKVIRFIKERMPMAFEIIFTMAVAFGCAALFSLACTSVHSIGKFFKKKPPPGGRGGHQSGARYFKFDSPKFKNSKFGSDKIIPQNSNQRIVLKRLIENNTVIITATYVKNGSRYNCHGRCLAIKGRVLLALRHYYEEHKVLAECGASFTLYFNVSGKQSFRPVTFEEIYGEITYAEVSSGQSNFIVCQLPKYIPQFRNIIPHIATLSQHNNLPRTGDIYVTGDKLYTDIEFKKTGKFVISSLEKVSSDVILESCYSYPVQGKGMCGSILTCLNANYGNGCIIGMHVAGSNTSGRGISEVLFREMFDGLTVDDRVDPPPLDLAPVDDDCLLDSNLMIYGKVDQQFAHHESGKSKYVPSLIAGQVYPVITEINPLKPNDPRQPPGSHPLYDGCNKHGYGYLEPIDKEKLEIIEQDLRNVLLTKVRSVRNEVRPLTLQQSICGDVSVPHFEPLNWNSSEGFPLSAYRPKGCFNKKWLFNLKETNEGYRLEGIHERLKRMLAVRWRAYKDGIVPFTLYVDCLKDYRLSPEKCKIRGKTRIISTSPVQLTIDFKRYVGDFMASYKNCHTVSEHAIGINPDSMEWTELVHYLSEKGSKIITGDYSNFGACVNSVFVSMCGRNIQSWYEWLGASPEHCEQVGLLMNEEIANPLHLCEDIVYRTINGIASGSPITAELNSEVNKALIRLVYLTLACQHNPKYYTMSSFHEFVRLVTYGDDFIMSVDESIIEWFNLVNIIDCFSKYGITVTPGDKSDHIEPYSDLSRSTFLKRGFKDHPFRANVVLAPVDCRSVEECVNWVHKSNDESEALIEVCRASMDLAFGHGPVYYKAHGDRLVSACRAVNVDFSYVSWRDRDYEIFGDCGMKNVSLKVSVPFYMDET